MEIDTQRWLNVLDQLEEARSVHRAINHQLFELDGQRQRVMGELARIEDRYRVHFGEPPAELSVASAHERLAAGTAKRDAMLTRFARGGGMQRGAIAGLERDDSTASYAMALAEARAATAKLTADYDRIDQRQATVSARLNELYSVAQAMGATGRYRLARRRRHYAGGPGSRYFGGGTEGRA